MLICSRLQCRDSLLLRRSWRRFLHATRARVLRALHNNSYNHQHNEKNSPGYRLQRHILDYGCGAYQRRKKNQRRVQQQNRQNGADDATHHEGNPSNIGLIVMQHSRGHRG